MKIFKKNKSCCCGENYTSKIIAIAEMAKNLDGIKVLGPGCTKCRALEKAVSSALAELGIDMKIEHVTDFAQIATYGVMSTPGLVVDDKVVSYGKVLNKEEAKSLIIKARS